MRRRKLDLNLGVVGMAAARLKPHVQEPSKLMRVIVGVARVEEEEARGVVGTWRGGRRDREDIRMEVVPGEIVDDPSLGHPSEGQDMCAVVGATNDLKCGAQSLGADIGGRG